jgi:hypothetical protein
MSYVAMSNGIPVVVVRANCDICKGAFTFTIPETEWLGWTQGGEHIQNAIKSLSADDRELFISGTCGKCFDALFADEEGDDA